MVKINRILSLFAVSYFYTLVAGKPVEETNYFLGEYESGDCKDLDAYLKTQNAELVMCGMTSNEDITDAEIKLDSINQNIINKLGSYSGTLKNVSFDKVTSIPKNLNLESLKIEKLRFNNRDHSFTDIPKNVLKTAKNVSIVDIYRFNLSQNNIKDIGSLTKLTELYINLCIVDNHMDYTNLKNLKNLITLSLDSILIKGENNKTLDKFPESICQMKKLKNLSLQGNDITTLPKCIKNLKKLEFINLYSNKLNSLPKEIGNLSNLKFIVLDFNQIETIPVEFSKLAKLENLSMSDNRISTLPDEFGNFASLKDLDLTYNSISSIPTAIGKLSNLEKLRLSNNKIYRIPSAITKLSNLKNLDLSENKIKVIADAIRKLKNLEYLYISDNLLTELPEALGELKNLKYLDLHGNDVNADDIPESLKNLPNLEIRY